MTLTLDAGSPLGLFLLFAAGFAASAMNAVAGGGSLLSFPLLVSLGISPLVANATNSVALWPGSFTGAVALRGELSRMGSYLRLLIVPTLVGSATGAWLLVSTPEKAFTLVVPVLLAIATTVLILQPAIRRWMTRRAHTVSPLVGVVIQLLVSIYGGYFGAGMGILMLAAFALYIEGTLHELNAIKACLAIVINLLASVYFVTSGLVAVLPATALAMGAILGGYLAGRISLRMSPDRIRYVAIALGAVMTARFTWAAIRGR